MMTRISLVFCLCGITFACGCGSRSGQNAAKKGMAAFKDGRNEKAIAYFTAATERITNSPELYYHLGLAHLKHGNLDLAQQAFQTALGLEPVEEATPASILGSLGQVNFHQKEYAHALTALDRALTSTTNDAARVRLLTTLGVIEAYRENHSLARLHYLRALRADRTYAPALYNLSVLYQDQYGLIEEALDNLEMFVRMVDKKDRKHEVARNRITRLQAKRDQAADRPPPRRDSARAASLLQDGMNAQFARPPQPARAITAYKSALAADPLTFHAAYGLGNLYRQQRMYAEALDAFKKASDINPPHQDCYCQAAEMALQLRQPAEAAKILSKAIARSPYNPASLKLMAQTAHAQARVPEAIAYGEFYLSILQDNKLDRDAPFERWVRDLKK